MIQIKNRMLRLDLFAVLVVTAFNLRAAEVSYHVSLEDRTVGLVNVTMEIQDAVGDSLDVAIPMWSPGGYGFMWYAKNIREVRAEDGNGNPLKIKQTDTSKWHISSAAPVVKIYYRVFIPERQGIIEANLLDCIQI